MHELSLAGGILRVLEQTRERDPFQRVTQLRLAVGALANVEIESLRFALDSIAPNTILAGASIEIDQHPAAPGACRAAAVLKSPRDWTPAPTVTATSSSPPAAPSCAWWTCKLCKLKPYPEGNHHVRSLRLQ
jgi:hydrogenase nickel incorporation protein HypA/HybF